MTMSQAVNAGARLDRLPISGFHRRLLWLIGAGAFMDAFDVYLAGGVMAKMVHEGFSSVAANASFLSAGFFGMMVGAAFAGYFGDRFGRRYSYQSNLLIFGLASLLGAFAPSIGMLTILRFIMGIGLGAEVVVAAGTLLEFIPPSHRGRWVSLLVIIVNFGFLASMVVAYFVIPALGWRWMFAIAGLGALAVWFARKKMPESPRWLESMGRMQEAEHELQAIEASVRKEHGMLPPVERTDPPQGAPLPVSALFAPGMLSRTVIGVLISVSTLVAIFSFVSWLPTFMVKEGFSIAKSLGFSTVMSFGGPLGGLVGFFIADRLSRKKSLILSCLAIIALGMIYPTLRDDVAVMAVGLALVSMIYTLVALGIYTYVPELFPTSIRLRGTGFSSMCGRAASIASPFLVVMVYEHAGMTGVLTMVAGLLVVLIGALLVAGIETGATSLERISETRVASETDITVMKGGR